MDQRVLLVAFNGEPMCFAHVLLNALDMQARGFDVKVVIEGTATKMVSELNDPEKPFGPLYLKLKEKSLIDCVCQACAATMGALDAAKEQNLPICGEMNGHPSLARYIEQGYRIITF